MLLIIVPFVETPALLTAGELKQLLVFLLEDLTGVFVPMVNFFVKQKRIFLLNLTLDMLGDKLCAI